MIVEFRVPPFPTFIKGGEGTFKTGSKHFRRIFNVFDFIYVKKGGLYITENGVNYEIRPFQYLILFPGFEHYGYKECEEDTDVIWIHFSIDHGYELVKEKHRRFGDILVNDGDFEEPSEFLFRIPKFHHIQQAARFETILNHLVELNSRIVEFPLRQQMSFEELLIQLQKEALNIPTATEKVVDQILEYISKNYKKPFTMEDMARDLHFHPDYLTRCMQKTHGMTPRQYVNLYRINKAKRHLSVTDDTISSIAKEIGIQDPTYFSKLFKKMEGFTPAEYRKMVRRNG